MANDDKTEELLASLPVEELAKVRPLSEEAINSALKQGKEDRRAAEACEVQVPGNSRVLFR